MGFNGSFSGSGGGGAGMVGARFQMYAETSGNAYRLGITAHSGAASATPPWGA